MSVKVCVLTGYGINADNELTAAFNMAGAEAEKIHINDFIENPALLRRYQIAGFAGGFSFGDHLGSGLVYAELVKKNLKLSLIILEQLLLLLLMVLSLIIMVVDTF